jgi:PAS domain S-box-containing protein
MDDTRRQWVAPHPSSALRTGSGLFESLYHSGWEACTTGLRRVRGDAVVGRDSHDHVFAHAPELLGIGTYDGLILKTNLAWQHTLGYTADELALTSLWDRVHPETHGVCRGAVRALVRTGTATVAVRMPHKDGTDRWISWTVVAASGRLFATGRDITERRRREGASAEAPKATEPKSTPRVLLAEDNRNTQRATMLRLTAAGFAVTLAPHGQAAVDLALAAETDGCPFDVVLMDMQMPVLDGYEATRTLRGEGYRRPIIAVTAHTMAEDRAECLRFGCDDYLAKPFDWPRLTALIASYAQVVLA